MTEPDDGVFYRYLNRILLIAAASAFGGGAIRFGTDRLTDEVSKLREMFQDHEYRIRNIEALILPAK